MALASFSLQTRGAEIPVSFQMGASANTVSLQFDVTSSGAVTFSGASGVGLGSHQIDSFTLPSGAQRFLIFSPTNSPLNASGTITATISTNLAASTSGFLTINASSVIATNSIGNTGAEPASTASPNALPSVLSLSPNSFLAVPQGTPQAWAIEALDPDGQVASVTFRFNSGAVATDYTAPFGGVWSANSLGDFIPSFIVTDNRGAQTEVVGESIVRVFPSSAFDTFPNFQNTFFPDGRNSASSADPFGIGLPNLTSFAFGVNPTAPDRNLYPTFTLEGEGDSQVAVYQATTRVLSGLSSFFEISNTLQSGTWTSPPPSWLSETALPNGLVRKTIRIPVGQSGVPSSFARLRITSTP
jgi:hypothetical protein